MLHFVRSVFLHI